MEYNLETIKDIVTIAKPVIDPLISTFIRPKLAKLSKWLKKEETLGQVDEMFFENKFEEYLARTYNYCQNINILIFQNQQIKIKEIYFPLTIKSTKDGKQIKIDDFKEDIIKPYGKILISDTAGMGKSTMMKWICTNIIENKLGIPILIELRNIREDNTILDEIFNQINPIDKSFDTDLILKLLELGHFYILLDGFDEIQLKNQEVIIKDIRNFIDKTQNNYFILTSRPEGALATFGNFQSFNILPLQETESFDLIRKYDSICPVKVADKLILDIQENFQQTKELLGNPFLVSLIYSTYTYNKDIPSNKVTFYEEIYSALYKRHDLSKEGWTRPKKSKLDIQQFKIILRQLAFDTAIIGTIAYTETELLQHITTAKQKSPGIEFTPSNFLNDLLSSVPLFQQDGSKIKWAHKSLQDYFAADYIAFDSRKEEILKRIYASKRDGFMNILELFYELDFKTFRNIIILQLLSEYIAFCNSSYKKVINVDKKCILERQAKTFDLEILIVKAVNMKNITGNYEKYKSEYFSNNPNTTGLLSVPEILYVYLRGSKRLIIDLLSNKQLGFIDFKEINPVILNESVIQLGKETFISDLPDSPCNSPANFNIINQLIEVILNKKDSKIPLLNFQKSLLEYTQIQSEIDLEKQTDNFKDI